jgi:hypothetical protein
VAVRTAERDLAKLPTWARHRIEALQADLAIARRDLAMALGGKGSITKVQVNPYNDGERCYLPAHATVRYWIGPRIEDYIDVRLFKHHAGGYCVAIMGISPIQIEPGAANVAYAKLQER